MASGYNFSESIGHGIVHTLHLPEDGMVAKLLLANHSFLITAVFVAGVVVTSGTIAKATLKKADNPLVPESGFSIRTIFESLAGLILWLGDAAMGPENRRYLPFVGSLFLFIFSMNICGLLPGFIMPTDQFQFNLGVALTVFVLYNFWGIKELGLFAYLKHLWGPVFLIGPMLFCIELISHAVRPVTLSLRLFGNMTGDHLALAIFTDLTKFAVPVAFYLLGTVVCFIQAFVFTLLTMVYIRLAVAHEH